MNRAGKGVNLRCSGSTASKKRCRRVFTPSLHSTDANGADPSVPESLYYCHLHKGKKVKKVAEEEKKTASDKAEDPMCVVCLYSVSAKDNAELKCGHWFHIECIKPLRVPTCPSCRKPIVENSRLTPADIAEIKQRAEPDKKERADEGTEELILQLLQEDREEYALQLMAEEDPILYIMYQMNTLRGGVRERRHRFMDLNFVLENEET